MGSRLARERGVRRYVLASSCSIYGFNSRDVHEGSRPNPLTAYAKANYRAERDTLLGVPLHTSQPSPPWTPSRVTLLGDAIHNLALDC